MGRVRERSQLDTVLLAVIASGPVDGYEIITAVRERTSARFVVSPGEVFPALHRLARNRMIARSRADPRRYTLTEGGRRLLSTKRRDWRQFAAAMQALLDHGQAVRG